MLCGFAQEELLLGGRGVLLNTVGWALSGCTKGWSLVVTGTGGQRLGSYSAELKIL